MDAELVPRPGWRKFLASFTAAHQGWLITVDSSQAGGHPTCLMRNVPLVGVFDEPERLVIVAGRGASRVERTLDHPAQVRWPRTAAGAETGLDIDTEAGERVHLRFRSAPAPELVDGVPG
jgi:hypothetical protein